MSEELTRQQRWYQENKDRLAESFRARYSANKEAFKAKNAKYREANREAIREQDASYKRMNPDVILRSNLRRYGVSLEDFRAMEKSQNGVCAICGRPPMGPHKRLSQDHDHAAKKARGLLCMHCNTMLGAASDNIEVLRKAIEYLERYSG